MWNASHATYFASALAEGLAACGSLEEAIGAAEWAIGEARRRGGTWDLPDLLRIEGVLLASRSPVDEGAIDAAFSAAIEVARRQGALSLELRATTALARERLRRGGSADDVRVLSAVYARFTEGFETPDLQAARELVERYGVVKRRDEAS